MAGDREDDLLDAERHGGLAPRHAEHGDAVHDPGRRPRRDDAGPDVLEGERPKELAEPGELFVDQWSDRLDRDVVRGYPRSASGDQDMDVPTLGERTDRLLDAVMGVADELSRHDLVTLGFDRRLDRVPARVAVERP